MATKRVIFTLDSDRDGDILRWLAAQPSKSAAIRAALRGAFVPAPVLDTAALRRVLREELARSRSGWPTRSRPNRRRRSRRGRAAGCDVLIPRKARQGVAMTEPTALPAVPSPGTVAADEADLLAAFADFLRLDVAQGDASPETIRAYAGQVQAFVTWCQAQGIRPAAASEADLKAYRAALVAEGYARSTIAARLNAVRRFYAMAQARGFRPDNPAQGIKSPPDRADRADRIKWLPLTAVSRLLAAPDAQTLKGKRDRAILVLMALHGLRVAEVVALQMADLDLTAPPLGRALRAGQRQEAPAQSCWSRRAGPPCKRGWPSGHRSQPRTRALCS